jgi:DNA-binding CsgD family transcriptional regulator/PAS domain-containing protein
MRTFRGAIEKKSIAPAQEDAVSPHLLSDVIGSIYDCTLDPSRWEQTLLEITQVMSAESAILSLNDLRHDRLLIDKSVGWGQFGLEERQKHIPEIHARLSEWFAEGPSLDEPFVASCRLTPDYLVSSSYVQHCLKPLGIVDIMHQFLMYTPLHFSEVVIARHQRCGPITDREIEIGKLLLPHLRRAVTISNVLDVRAIERARMAEALDGLRCGVVLTNGDGNILHANHSAELMLQNGSAVQGIGGILKAKSPAAAQELRKAISLAARDEAKLGKTGLAIPLTGPEAPPLVAHVLPMNGSELRTRLQPEAAVAVFIGASMTTALDLTPAETKEYLRRRFGLTLAEANVALEVLNGDGRGAVAARLGISMTTVRTHLSSIFEKTGVRRQAELVRLLMRCDGS